MFVIKNLESGRYVRPFSKGMSLTDDIHKAKAFRSREAAEADKFDNEIVVEYTP